jgi:hypothetical protein
MHAAPQAAWHGRDAVRHTGSDLMHLKRPWLVRFQRWTTIAASVWLGAVGLVALGARPAQAATPTAIEAPLPPNGGGSSVGALACPAPGSCVAVGSYSAPRGQEGLIETLANGTWTATKAPKPANAYRYQASLDPMAVACSAVGSCVAVGSYHSTAGQRGLIEILANGRWTARGAPLPKNAVSIQTTAQLDAVACPSAKSCVAFGLYNTKGQNQVGVIDTMLGRKWSPTRAPLPSNASIGQSLQVTALTCPAPGSCVGTGTYSDISGDTEGLIETLSGGSWAPSEAPLPDDAGAIPNVSLNAVACPSPGSCDVVGGYQDANGDGEGLIETLAGGTWSPLGTAGTGGYDALACPDSDSCVAVFGVIETLADNMWSTTTPPLPANAGSTSPFGSPLFAVSCRDGADCIAVGTYGDTSGNRQGLIETLSGSTWTPTEATLPANASSHQGALLDALACPATGSCFAVGNYIDSNGSEESFIETVSGT